MSARIAAIATCLGADRNAHGAAVDPGRNEIAMGVKVAREAVERSFQAATDFDSIVFATSGIRHVFPSGAAAIAESLNVSCPAFDVSAGCASMGIAVETAARGSGTTLVVCSDVLSQTIDAKEPTHAPLRAFGDGAAAVVISHTEGPGPRIVSHRGRTVGYWRQFYSSKDGRLVRSLPPDKNKDLREAYLHAWAEIGRELLKLCRSGCERWVYANQGDTKLFPQLAEALELPDERIVRTNHGHAGGADPWIGLQTQPPPGGSAAILLSSGIGFMFHGTLLEMA